MIPEEAWSLIPEYLPSDLNPWVPRLVEQAAFDSRQARAYSWAMHLLSQLTNRVATTAIMGLPTVQRSPFPPVISDISAGFIPFSLEASDSFSALRRRRLQYDAPFVQQGGFGYSFGLVIGLQQEEKRTKDPEPDDQRPSQLLNITGFPVLVEYRQITYAAPPSPLGAASACYAKPRTSKRFYGPAWTSGIVIARHSLSSVGFTTGVSVPMVPAGSLSVADIDGSTVIDAAILDCGTLPLSAGPLSLASAVAPGSSVAVRAHSGNFSATVLRVNDHPSYYGNLVAHRVFLDAVGITGDSGSLVMSSAPSPDCVGLYMGSTSGSFAEGIVQSMRQVVNYFDIDLYD